MNPRFNEQIELLALAMRRYPDVMPDLALLYFASDRRAAGLGSLDLRNPRRRSQNPRRNLQNTKQFNHLTGAVMYDRVLDVPPRQTFEGSMPSSVKSIGDDAFLTIKTLAARHGHLRLDVEPDRLKTQKGRNYVAQELRKMRAMVT